MHTKKKKKQHPGPKKRDRLKGPTGFVLAVIAALEFLLYWYLVFRFPSVMIPVSIILTLVALYFRARSGALESFREELDLSGSDLAWLKRYCTAWVFIPLYGLVFCLVLIS